MKSLNKPSGAKKEDIVRALEKRNSALIAVLHDIKSTHRRLLLETGIATPETVDAFFAESEEEAALLERWRSRGMAAAADSAKETLQDERANFEVAGLKEGYNLVRNAKNRDEYAFPAAKAAWWAWQTRSARHSTDGI